jgi:hypothetical protein
VGMASGIERLRAMSEDELVKAHDETNLNRALPSTYFLDELRRREAARAEAASYNLSEASHKLAKRVLWLTVVNAVFAAVAAIAAVVALLAQANPCG